jgi:hypothetical protein
VRGFAVVCNEEVVSTAIVVVWQCSRYGGGDMAVTSTHGTAEVWW